MTIGEYMSVNDAAEMLGCTGGRVRQLLNENEIRGEKLNGRAWIIPKSEVQRYSEKPRTVGRPRKKEDRKP